MQEPLKIDAEYRLKEAQDRINDLLMKFRNLNG